jgi:gas vesicle protein
MSNSNYSKGLITGLIIGAVAGAITALLTTPKTGEELRKDISDKSKDLLDQTKDIIDDIKVKAGNAIEGVIDNAKQKIATVISEHEDNRNEENIEEL